jgi:leucyl aminopeptidase
MHVARLVHGQAQLATTLPAVGADRADSVQAFVEGFILGGYRYDRSGSGTASAPRVQLLVDASEVRRAGVVQALAAACETAGRANWVRQLVETPSSELGPAQLAEVFREEARAAGVRCRVWTRRTLESKNFGGVLGVGQGSSREPQVVELRLGEGRKPAIALTGKGITFDSGGINIKQDSDEIAWMKADMAGAAAAAGATFSAARFGLEVDVVAVLPLAENMPGGKALRPGDVVRHPGGITTEVTNTDCEGRLVLADAVAYLQALKPAAVVDVGTLTDAGGVGHARWAVMGNDDALVRRLLTAGTAAGDPGWQLPLVQSYVQLLRSPVADLVNCASEVPDTSVLAGTYLREFAGTTPWAHIDNGSTAYLELAADGWPKGATGSPVRALIRFLQESQSLR